MPAGPVGLVAGVFDLFHVGHLDAVLRSAAGSGRLVVGVASDELAETVTGRRPFVPEIERREIVGALRGVDGVVVLDEGDLAGQVAATGAGTVYVAGSDETAERVARAVEAGAPGVAVVRLGSGRGTASIAVRAALREATGGGTGEHRRSSVA